MHYAYAHGVRCLKSVVEGLDLVKPLVNFEVKNESFVALAWYLVGAAIF